MPAEQILPDYSVFIYCFLMGVILFYLFKKE